MATSIGNLAVILSANTNKYGSGMRRAGSHTQNFAVTFKRSMASVFSMLGRLSALVAGGGFIAGLTSQFRRLDDIAKTAGKIGMTTEELSRLQFAGEQTGVAVNTMNMALQRMTRRISEAAAGTGEAKAAIKELGLDAVALNAMGPSKAFSAIADAMKQVENPTDRLRLAFKLFDSEGAALVNTLEGGSEEIARYAEQSDRLGNTVSDGATKAAEEFNDALNRLKVAVGGLFSSIATGLAPSLQNLSDKFTGVVEAMRSNNAQNIKNIASNTALVAGFVAGTVAAGKMIAVIGSIIKAYRGLATAQSIVSALSGPKGWIQLAAGLAAAAGAAHLVNQAFDGLAESVKRPAAEVQSLSGDIEDATAKINDSIESVTDNIEEVHDPLEGAWHGTRQLSDGFKDAESAAKRLFESTRTDAERLAAKIAEINQLFKDGLINGDTARRAFDQLSEGQQSNIADRMEQRDPSRRIDFAAMGAAAASGRKTDQMLKATQEQLAEDKRRARIQEETLRAIRNTGSVRVVNF